ncbi:hypothetical protein LCGC14_2963490 [marine sediment metagenome]|uniref:Uncharacterized protein n=1 Tax=marine sediment metagenome TaxID=412755 RepID=A0A0F8XCD9_9ZZZZ
MRYKGKKLGERNIDVLVLLRGEERIVIKAQAVDSYKEFDELVSLPVAPEIIKPGGMREKNTKDKGYKKAVSEYADRKTNWLIITALKASEDIEWEKVDYDDPVTWHMWEVELKEAGFIEIECKSFRQLPKRK